MIQELEGSSSKNGAVESVCRQAEKIDQILNFLLIETEGHEKVHGLQDRFGAASRCKPNDLS